MSRASRASVSNPPEINKPPVRTLLSSIILNETQHSGRYHRRVSLWPYINILRRLAVIAAAIQYVYISLTATSYAWQMLRATPNPPETLRIFSTSLIAGYLGDGLIQHSPLVENILQGNSTPRDYVLFLESAKKTSTKNCSSVPLFNAKIYNHDFLSRTYDGMIKDAEYNATVLGELETVLFVVDCSFTQIIKGDASTTRVFNVARSQEDPGLLYVVMMSLNVQNFEIPEQNKQGVGLLAFLTVVEDMQAGILEQVYLLAQQYPYQRFVEFQVYQPDGITNDSFQQLRSIPRDSTESVENLIASRKRGFYNGEEQANTRNMHTVQDHSDATRTLTQWEWVGQTVEFDSYAWVHGIHLVFGMQTVYNLVVLSLVTYQKVRSRKMWIGDPFASVSTATLVSRAIVVVFTMYVNSFWSITEYCLAFASAVTSSQSVLIHQELVHADILDIYLGLAALVSSFFRERIDPAVAIFLFEIVHSHRLAIVRMSAAVVHEITAYSSSQSSAGVAHVSSTLATITPLRFWTAYQLPSRDGLFLVSSFFPKAVLLAIIAGYAFLRKIYHLRRHPDEIRLRSSQVTDRSSVSEKSAMTQRGVVTHFELSTGVELQTRYGIISDYSNYVYFKGMKFASADGVYCSGYVIANGKFLVSSKDLLAVVVMKIVGFRFKNVYVYEVDGNSVKETARLVSPKTFMWSDLWRLNVIVLL